MKSVALVGLGAVVRNIHMPAYAQLGGRMRVVAGCDPNSEAREQARRKWGIAVFENAEEMLTATRPDIAVIATPPWLHREQVCLALEHGCHVFCEKPAAETLEDVDAMTRRAESAGRLIVVNNQFPYMAIHLAAKEQIGSPEFGELLYLQVWQTMQAHEPAEDGWRGGLARRLCFEFGVHVFELVRFFFEQDPIRIMAHMPNPLGRTQCDLINVIALEFADGRAASIILDRVSRGPERYLDMRLDGERGSVHTSIGGRLRFEAGIHTRERRPFAGLTFVKGGKAELEHGSRSQLIAKEGMNPFADSTARHFANLLDGIENGVTPRGHIGDNRHTLALVMAAYDSAASGRWVDMKQYAAQETPPARV